MTETSRTTLVHEEVLTIQNRLGLHVRPSQKFAETAALYKAEVCVKGPDEEVDGKSSIELLMLAAVCGTELVVRAEGEDAQDAVAALKALVDGRFGEE